jgi:hypothetical protein
VICEWLECKLFGGCTAYAESSLPEFALIFLSQLASRSRFAMLLHDQHFLRVGASYLLREQVGYNSFDKLFL